VAASKAAPIRAGRISIIMIVSFGLAGVFLPASCDDSLQYWETSPGELMIVRHGRHRG
jgi:hypothetical protein